jgi:predicted nucleotidyltransferase/DNA-binding XRE family transcriptional regulator
MVPNSAAALIRGARIRAALTQTELARFAGVAQSVVSAYESGRREPSLDMVRRLVEASGFDLDMVLTPARPRSPLRNSVDAHRVQLRRVLLGMGAKNIRLFGSVARGEDRPDSDVDLLIDVGPNVGLFALGRMRTEAERILGSKVDIVLAQGLKSDLSDQVLAEAIPL